MLLDKFLLKNSSLALLSYVLQFFFTCKSNLKWRFPLFWQSVHSSKSWSGRDLPKTSNSMSFPTNLAPPRCPIVMNLASSSIWSLRSLNRWMAWTCPLWKTTALLFSTLMEMQKLCHSKGSTSSSSPRILENWFSFLPRLSTIWANWNVFRKIQRKKYF